MSTTINQFDLIEAGKYLGINNPLKAYSENKAIASCLRAYAKNIARKRRQHQQTTDLKRLQAGDIA